MPKIPSTETPDFTKKMGGSDDNADDQEEGDLLGLPGADNSSEEENDSGSGTTDSSDESESSESSDEEEENDTDFAHTVKSQNSKHRLKLLM